MKSLNRIAALLGPIAGIAIASTTGTIVHAQEAPNSTPEAQTNSICERRAEATVSRFCQQLLQIPVFTITDGEGSPLVTTVERPDGSMQDIGGVFLNPEEAQSFVASLQESQADLRDRVQVSVLTLAEIYEADRANHIQQEAPMEFAYVPSSQQLEQVRALYAERDITIESFDGVPLFFAMSRADGGYMTIEQEGQSRIPVYFDKDGLDSLIENFGGGEEFTNSVQYDVLRLERVLQTMQVLETLEQLDAIVSNDSSVEPEVTLIPRLPEMMLPEMLAILSQGETDPLAAAIAMRLQDDSLDGEAPIDRVTALLESEIETLLETGTPSPLWSEIRQELNLGLGQTLEQLAFFPSMNSVQFIRSLLEQP